ncbi:MAG: hypothetical protein ABL933_10500 [Methyloglobulus sp.]|nr:hypothetical protein [Methyloglobulus sp.]
MSWHCSTYGIHTHQQAADHPSSDALGVPALDPKCTCGNPMYNTVQSGWLRPDEIFETIRETQQY